MCTFNGIWYKGGCEGGAKVLQGDAKGLQGGCIPVAVPLTVPGAKGLRKRYKSGAKIKKVGGSNMIGFQLVLST